MSTKIYNAYKVCDNNVETVFKIKKELEPLYENFVHDILSTYGKISVKQAADLLNGSLSKYDLPLDKKSMPVNKQLHFLICNILEAHIESGRNLPLNVEAAVTLFEHKGNLYLQFFGFPNSYFGKYFKQLERRKIIADWHYQDSVDKPAKIKKKDWAERELVWDQIYDSYYSPAQPGFVHKFSDRLLAICLSFEKKMRKADEAAKDSMNASPANGN